jgi:hypothetical protein
MDKALRKLIWKLLQTNSVALVHEWTILTEWPLLVGEVSANIYGERVSHGQHNKSLGHNLGFLAGSHYTSFQVAPQLYSRGRVDPVLDSQLLRKSGSAENRTRTSGFVARNPDH